jgi:hypothetical protein
VTTASKDPYLYFFFVWVDLLAPGTAPFLAGRGVAFFALMNRPVFGSRPTRIDVAFERLFTMFSPHRLAQLFPCRELGRFARRQVEGLTGPGIAPGSGLLPYCRKRPKPYQGHFFALAQRVLDTREKGVDDLFRLPLGQCRVLGNPRHQLSFGHGSFLLCPLIPTGAIHSFDEQRTLTFSIEAI